jgi:hypothetical protein
VASARAFDDDPEAALTCKFPQGRRCLIPAIYALNQVLGVETETVGRMLRISVKNVCRSRSRWPEMFDRAVEAAKAVLVGVEPIRCPKPIDRFILATLERLADADGYATASLAEISTATKLSRSAVTRNLHKLAEAGKIEVTPGGPLTSNRYRIVRAAPVLPSSPVPANPPICQPAAETSTAAASVNKAPAPKPQRQRPPAGRQFARGAKFESLGDGVQVIRLKPINPKIVERYRQQMRFGISAEEFADLWDVDPEALKRAAKAETVG